MANEAVTCGFIALITITGLAWLAVQWPAVPFWHNQEAFAGVIGNTPPSLAAYIVSQKHDIWLQTPHGRTFFVVAQLAYSKK